MPPRKKPARSPIVDDPEIEALERPDLPFDENDPERRDDLARNAERFVSGSWGYMGPDE